jgi:hypothetical protein
MEALAAPTRRDAPAPASLAILALWSLAVALVFDPCGSRSEPLYSEGAVKAAYLYRFTQYVEWPRPPDPPFTIAVMDAPQVASELAHLLPTHPIDALPAQVRTIHSMSEIGDAAMLYLGPGDPQRLRAEIRAIASRPILVVTDDAAGLSLGGVINFVEISNRIRFEVSTGAAARSKLHVSAELLSVATRVERSSSP